MKRYLTFLLIILSLSYLRSTAGVRIKDIAKIQGLRGTQLIGYGLVVGLDGTGDGRRSLFTIQSVTNMLKRFGITVPQHRVRLENVAAVMVTAQIPPFMKVGSRVDVIVSSLGDATSLEGGTLLLTPLFGPDGTLYAMAQGPVSIGGFNVETIGGERVRKNYTLVGRVPEGATVEKEIPQDFVKDQKLSLVLENPDFTTANRLAQAINQDLGKHIAVPVDAAQVTVNIPPDYQNPGGIVDFISRVESLEITPDEVARVVVNERTGTIIVGEKVTISTVAVSHGNLSIEITTIPVISQPPPFSKGKTVVVPQTETRVTTEEARMMVIEQTASVKDVAYALNALGVTPRDIIAIFQALKEAGALKAELIIM